MKVPASIRALYEPQQEECARLRAHVDKRLGSIRKAAWHYESRLKGEESFALKAESGRFPDPRHMEDFLACWLVVENQTQVHAAEELVTSNYDVHQRRPRLDDFTHKKPEAFPFDDLRLYVRLRDDPSLPPTGLSHIVFEVQIRTFLQHAWTIATHDLVYKADTASWPTQRIAFQVKAMLEHAEVSIAEAENLAKAPGLHKTDSRTKDILAIIQLLRELWPADRLPKDALRLARNVSDLIHAVGLSPDKLKKYLQAETEAGKGAALENVSPYGAIVQSLVNQDPECVVRFLATPNPHNDFRLLVPMEVDMPSSLSAVQSERFIRV